MIHRVEIRQKFFDTRVLLRKKSLQDLCGNGKIKNVQIIDVYTIEKDLTPSELDIISLALANPVTQKASTTYTKPSRFNFCIEIGYLPGVTDNVAHTTKELIEDLLKIKFSSVEEVYTSQMSFISGNLNSNDVNRIGISLINPLIQRIHIKNFDTYQKENGMDSIVPRVSIVKKPKVITVDLHTSENELIKIGKYGIKNSDGSRRGPLALDLSSLKSIRNFFSSLKRFPTDIELESLAQTWSEHCKHTIFTSPIDELKDGLYKTYIQGATNKIRSIKKGDDMCVSVFTDNSGAIAFDETYLITHKVETHNSPSALDPFGGAVTGIVGVNRDTIGFGLGARPIANMYGFCFADPRVDKPLYKGNHFTQKMVSSRKIMNGVIRGVNAGGNQSGIPTPLGFVFFDERFRGKPLVFVGTIGLIPRKIKGKPSHVKKALCGDYIVMVGGRVGKDGIHGATFSSTALDSGSPVTAVQIGDPITQKKLSDAIILEARDKLLYNSITDNGAGGLSCSVAEMAKESGGCRVDLEKVPLKYSGLQPWEIWVSESQERMTLAVSPKKWKAFLNLMSRRGVEATVIGEFTDSGHCIVRFHNSIIMDIQMQFLHSGPPKRLFISKFTHKKFLEPEILPQTNLTRDFLEILGRQNIASFSFITQQYDHMVGGTLVSSPLVGRGLINADSSVIRPVLTSKKGLAMSSGVYPTYGDIDTYHMVAACIDTAIRNVVASGANIDKIALLDNFCWCDSFDPYRLGQLKRAAKACFDYATAFQTPFISGKDSMFNDFHGYDLNGKPIHISIPPTFLASSIGIIDDIYLTVSLDLKIPGDLLYVLGDTYDELGASEYYAYLSEKYNKKWIGNNVPKTDAMKNRKLYQAIFCTIQKGLIASSIGISRGGLAVSLTKSAMGGMLGVDVAIRNNFALFSESQGRVLVSVNPAKKERFEKMMMGYSCYYIGKVRTDEKIIIKGKHNKVIVNTNLSQALKFYRNTFKGY